MRATNADLACQFVDSKLRIVNMGLQSLYYIAKQFFFRTTVDGCGIVVKSDLRAPYPAHYSFANSDTVCNCPLKHKQIERFAQKMIDIQIETENLCAIAIFTCKHDYR